MHAVLLNTTIDPARAGEAQSLLGTDVVLACASENRVRDVLHNFNAAAPSGAVSVPDTSDGRVRHGHSRSLMRQTALC